MAATRTAKAYPDNVEIPMEADKSDFDDVLHEVLFSLAGELPKGARIRCQLSDLSVNVSPLDRRTIRSLLRWCREAFQRAKGTRMRGLDFVSGRLGRHVFFEMVPWGPQPRNLLAGAMGLRAEGRRALRDQGPVLTIVKPPNRPCSGVRVEWVIED